MVDTAFSVAVKAAECLVAVGPPIAQLFSYIWNYETHFDKLDTELRKLKGQRDKVRHSVEEARRNGEQIEQLVNNWLDRVHTIIAEVSKVIEENERADMICFMGLCPNPKKRYQHSSKAVEKTEVVAGLYDERNFPTVSFRTIPEETWIPSYKGYMVFESRMSTLKNIIDALSNPDVNMVGIYGTGGIGKTTLAKEIVQHAEDKKLFNVVAFAEVAVKPDKKNIQQEIADKLGLTFREESVSGRARSLRQRLKQEEKVLLVLDNIWDKLDLEDVGIPFGNDGEGCKLLLTARILDVLLEMESQKKFEVGILDEGEAWSLYEKKAGVCDHLQALAKDVALACGGLPIAIDSVAVALKNKEECEWKDALRKLTVPSTSNFEGVSAKTYSCIEISYDQLKEKELKSTFLLCCVMENTHIEDLLAYVMGLGIFEKVEAMKDARNRVKTLLRKLKNSSLLLDINKYWFSLHDVVRDVGTSITSRDWNMFCNCTIRESIDKDALMNCLAITLHISKSFPKRMPKLKVLHLVGFVNSMPNSIGLLVNLRTLYIDDCELRDIDFVGEIKQLEILRIHGSYCSKIEMIPKKMCNLTGLSKPSEKIKAPGDNTNLLSYAKFELEIKEAETVYVLMGKETQADMELERYRITFGSNVRSEFYRLRETSRRAVKLNLESSSCFDDIQEFLSVLDTEGFPELEHLWVENSPGFRTVVDCLESESCHNHFLSLEWLNLFNLNNLERIHNHQLRAESFQRLTTLEVVKCNKLKNIFSFSTYRALPLLQQVYVSSCDNMEEIFAINRREEGINNDEGTDQIEFKQLHSLRLKSLPKLISFCSINGNKDILDTPTPLFNQKVAFPSLEEIETSGMLLSELEMIWPNQLCKDSFCNLKSLEVTKCNKLLTIFQSNMFERITGLESLTVVSIAESLSELQQLDVHHCGVEEIVGDDPREANVAATFVTFSSLEEIEISESNNLKMVWHKRAKESFFNLKSMQVSDCNSLLTILQFSIPRLLTVGVSGCALVEENFDLQKVNFEELYIRGLPKLKHIWNKDPHVKLSFEELPMPKRLSAGYCDLIEEIFDLQNVNFEESHSGAITQQLQELIISSLPKLKHIWNKDPQTELFFNVLYCGQMEEIIAKEGEAKAVVIFVFPEVTSIKLNKLPQLRTFYPGVHSSKWLALKELEVVGCDKMELLASELFSFQENNEESQLEIPAQQPLFLVEKDSFPYLEKLILGGNAIKLMILLGQFSEELICNLKFFEVLDEESVVFPLCILKRVRHLQKLCLISCSYKEIFSYQEDETHVWIDSKLDTVLQKLESLEVEGCHNLIQLWPSSASFQNLTFLRVWHCNGLKNLMTSSTAKSLVQLRKMIIRHCNSMIEVVTKEGDVTEEDEITFSKLRSLKLDDLPKLSCFCSENCTFKLPSLEKLTLYSCPKMKCFSSRDRIRHLQKLHLESSSYKEIFSYEDDETDVENLIKLVPSSVAMD
ncbi:hypothetical protein EZV62_007020 [Acer yangbiense]|uniref:AAA+ ATPase domain-containing protein n=1 Tax=Acer yangbiense TaxID=1000413 RepID=A0A5C7I941_9ROSI|nr:hypothetical protein EZV62_007020 [Acer yangbiense]